jgi:hypothetical protein
MCNCTFTNFLSCPVCQAEYEEWHSHVFNHDSIIEEMDLTINEFITELEQADGNQKENGRNSNRKPAA